MAAATIRTYISRINMLLAQDEIRIGRRAGGYQLSVDPQAVDLYAFRSLRRQAESVAGSGDLGHGAALLRRADDLWRGPALMGLSGEWASARRQVLDEERDEAVKLRIGFELDLGHQASVLGEIRELSREHPFDEEIARALMIALYRLGRQADALQVGRDMSERLAEAGIQPGSQLRDVQLRILRDNVGLGITPQYRSSEQRTQPNTLPAQASDFVGRTAELERLTAGSQGNAPLCRVIVGLGGVGKSALAVHAAHRMAGRYPDAQLYVSLAGKGPDGAAEALQQLLRMLGVPAARVPAGTGARAMLWQAEIAHRRVVVVLDGALGAEQVNPIAAVAGDSLTIVTSRQRTGWSGQQVLSLEPLGISDSVTLLERVAGLASGQDADKTARAVSLCGGLPLVLRLEAARIRAGDLADLDSLISELADVRAGRVDGTETGRRIFSAFESTYRQLTAEDRRMFRLLGASPCADFGLDTAVALAGRARADAEECIRALSGRCLLEQASEGRFRLHDIVRSFAAACCASEEPEPERRRAVGRLIRYYSEALAAATAEDGEFYRQHGVDHPDADHSKAPVQFPDADSAHAWLETEWRSILLTAQHAATHELHRQCADLSHSLARFLHLAGYWSDAVPAHELALQAGRLISDPARIARAALDLSIACHRTGDHDKARRHANAALTVYMSVGDRRGQATALDQFGIICWSSGSARDGLAYHQEAADLYRDAGDQSGVATAVMHTAISLGSLGRYPEEARSLDRALSLFREAGDRRGEALCLNNLGAVLDDQGLHRDAVKRYEESIAIFREIGGRQNLTLLDHNLGRIRLYKGRYAEAVAIFRKALAAYRVIGDLPHQAVALSDIADAFKGRECHSEALAHYRQSAELAEAIGDRAQYAAALCGMGDAYRGSGSYGSAAEHYDKAHRLATEIEAPYVNGKALYGLAETLLVTEGAGAAKIYWREALDIFTQLGVHEAAIVEVRLHGVGASAS
jgi:tetratricopeptide (TPR) repeat protein/DNA-binding SARP family transcriptional activator